MNIQKKLYLATIAEDAHLLASHYNLGIEVNEFCTAANMDLDFARWDAKARANMAGIKRFVFHAPFNEIHPSAIDPKARRLAMDRLEQAYQLAATYGIRRMVVHSGFLPDVYFPQWFFDRSVEFWQEFMADKPADFELLIENQLEPEAELLPRLCERLRHPRIRLCLDTGHALYRSKQDIFHWADCFAPYCDHLHLHNNDRVWDWHWCLDRGAIPMAKFLPYVLKKMPSATITLEHLKAADSIQWLVQQGYLTEPDVSPKNTEPQVHSIPPVFDARSEILILGSFPSVKSREGQFFYHHPQNRFWRVLAAVLNEPLPETIEEKRRLLLTHHIALWDVIASCRISGSSDSSIRDVRPNCLKPILETAHLKQVFLNGGKAYTLYHRYLSDKISLPAVKLPSTSPANAAWSMERLIDAWRQITLPLTR